MPEKIIWVFETGAVKITTLELYDLMEDNGFVDYYYSILITAFCLVDFTPPVDEAELYYGRNI